MMVFWNSLIVVKVQKRPVNILNTYHEPDALHKYCLIHTTALKGKYHYHSQVCLPKVMQLKCKYTKMLFVQPKVKGKIKVPHINYFAWLSKLFFHICYRYFHPQWISWLEKAIRLAAEENGRSYSRLWRF